MYAEQLPYRELYDAILDAGALGDLAESWLRRYGAEERRWLETISRRRGSPIPTITDEESCRLYALSRVAQLLQSDPAFEPFMTALGLERVRETAFDPFLHEIVVVEPSNDAPVVTNEYWPAFMLGPLLVHRAGCRVAAPERVMRKEIAETTTLYWALSRPNRPAHDLSHGWGSNSQWRTAFRRDYRIDGVRYYNVDAFAGADESDDLTEAERIELLRYRSFVTCTKRDDDRFPYRYSFRE